MYSRIFLILIALSLGNCASDNPVDGNAPRFFVVQVGSEQFTMRLTDPVAIQLAIENFERRNNRFPSGRIAAGNGGYNQWNWHFIPETVQMVEASVEVCDALPSYVHANVNDFLNVGYCPWSARVIQLGR